MTTRTKLFFVVLVALMALVPQFAFARVCDSDTEYAVEFTAVIGGIDYVCDFRCTNLIVDEGTCTSLGRSETWLITFGRFRERLRGRFGNPKGYTGILNTDLGQITVNYIAASTDDIDGAGLMQLQVEGEQAQSSAIRYRETGLE